MMASVDPASGPESTDPPPSIPNILERLGRLADENPDLTTYVVAGEADAQLLLAALAATLQAAAKTLSDDQAKPLRRVANTYRDAVLGWRALDLIRNGQDDPGEAIEVAGLAIRAPRTN
jgi:hypothetical protein